MKVEIRATETFTDLKADLGKGQAPLQLRLPTRGTAPLSSVNEIIELFKTQNPDVGEISEIQLSSDWGEQILTSKNSTDVALLVTEGFEDLLETASWNPLDSDSLKPERELPLLHEDLVFGITERISVQGEKIVNLQASDIDFLISKLQLLKTELVAICFLHSPQQPEHENRAAEILRKAGLSVALSHELCPRGNEWQRAQTTVAAQILKSFWRKRIQELRALMPQAQWSFTSNDMNIIDEEKFLEKPQRHLFSTIAQTTEEAVLEIGFVSSQILEKKKEKPQGTGLGSANVSLWFDGIDLHTMYLPVGLGSTIETKFGQILALTKQTVSAELGPAALGRSTKLTVFDCLVKCGLAQAENYFSYKSTSDAVQLDSLLQLLSKQLDCSMEETAQAASALFARTIVSKLMALFPQTARWKLCSRLGSEFDSWFCSQARDWNLDIRPLS